MTTGNDSKEGIKKKKSSFRKFCLIVWVMSFLLGTTIFILEILNVGTINSIPFLSVFVPIASGITFVVFFCLWMLHLIIRKTKVVLIVFFGSVLILATPIFIYEKIKTGKEKAVLIQQKVACNMVAQVGLDYYNAVTKNDSFTKLTKDTTNVNWTDAQNALALSDYKNAQVEIDKTIDLEKQRMDVYSKYSPFFATTDISSVYKSVQGMRNAYDLYYSDAINYFQSLVDVKPPSESDKLYKVWTDATDKLNEIKKDQNVMNDLNRFDSAMNSLYSMCNFLFNTPLYQASPSGQNSSGTVLQ